MDKSLNRIILTYVRSVKYLEEAELHDKILTVKQKLIQQEVAASGLEQEDEKESKTRVFGSVSEVVESINSSIIKQGFKIVKCINEINNSMTYVFVNLNSDQEIDKQMTVFKDSEIYIIKLIIDEIVSNNYHIPPSILINRLVTVINNSANSVISNKSSKELSKLINRLISLGYLQLVNNSYLIMSIRLLSELKSYLANNFDMLWCENCHEIVTIGLTKGNVHFHYKCYDIYARNRRIANNEPIEKIGIEI